MKITHAIIRVSSVDVRVATTRLSSPRQQTGLQNLQDGPYTSRELI